MGGVIYNWRAEPFYKWSIDNSFNKEECCRKMKLFDFDPHMSGLQSDKEMSMQFCEFCHIPYKEGIEKELTKAMMDGNEGEFEATIRAMKFVLNKGAKNAMLSNASPSFSYAWRNDELINNEHRFFSFDLKTVKPNLQIYKLVKDKLGVEFEEMVFIDDRQENVDAAKKLGIKGIVFDESTIEDEIRRLFN